MAGNGRQPGPWHPPRCATRRALLRRVLAAPLVASAGTRPRSSDAASQPTRSIAVRPRAVLAGGLLTIDGIGFPESVTGRLVWEATGERLGAFTTDDQGRFRSAAIAPAGRAGEGEFAVVARAGGRSARGSVSITVPTGSPIALGAFIPGAPGNGARIDEFVKQTNGQLAIIMWFHHWGLKATKALDTKLLDAVRERGAVPMITWEPWDPTRPAEPAFDLAEIAAGRHDRYITAWAKGLRDWEHRVLLRWGHEMNGDWYPWSAGGDRPRRNARAYKAAWRRIHDRFVELGATNVEWVWSPNVSYPGSAALDDLYPGDAYVDWIGVDGYNWGTTSPDHRWKRFSRLFGPTLSELRRLAADKPMIIAETASAEEGGSKSGWIRAALLHDLPFRYPEVRGLVWFDESKERDWSVDSSVAARRAFAAAASHPYYKGPLAELAAPTGLARRESTSRTGSAPPTRTDGQSPSTRKRRPDRS